MKRFLFVAVLFGFSFLITVPLLHAQSATVLTVTYEREGVPVPHWEMRFATDGSAEFASRPTDAEPVSRAIQLSAQAWKKMQQLLVTSDYLVPCESKSRNLARIGIKTVEWTPAGEATVRCSFNYTDNKALSELTDIWTGMAATLDEGRRITQLHKHDRLGLDKELADYAHSVEQGFAVEPRLIEPELRALVEDELVMERVRTRALRLLSGATKRR